MSNDKSFNPMDFVVPETDGGGLPVGQYEGAFLGIDHLPVKEADPMTGEGKREYPNYVFKWEITKGDFAGKVVSRETSTNVGIKTKFAEVVGMVRGSPLAPKEAVQLKQFIGKKYMLAVSKKLDKNGNPKEWTHVSNAIKMSE